MFFGSSFGSCKTPVPTSRDHQEKVVRLAQQDRSRSRCASAQPTRSASVSQLWGSSTGTPHLAHRPPSATRPLTQKIHAPRSQEERVPTPELKHLVCAPDVRLIHDTSAAARHLNGPVSPSRTRVKRTIAETVNEIGRSRSVSPDNNETPHPAPPQLSSSANLQRSHSDFACPASSANNEQHRRPSSASPAVFHTVGPREFARLKIKMRSQSPWALHVEDDQLTHQAQTVAKQLEKRAKQALWVESLAQAVETRKQSAHETRIATLASEVDVLSRAKCMTELHMLEKRRQIEEKLQNQRAEYSLLQSRKESDEASKKALRVLAVLEHTGFMRDEEASKALAQLGRHDKLLARRSEMADASIRRQAAQAKDDDPDEAASRRVYLSELENRRRVRDNMILDSRRRIANRAAIVVSKIGTSKKQQTLDRLDAAFEETAQHLLADNINRVESIQQAARLRNQHASQERLRVMGQRATAQRTEREALLNEENVTLARDRESKAIYDQVRAQLKAQQTNEVREQLELQRRVAMKRALDDATAEL